MRVVQKNRKKDPIEEIRFVPRTVRSPTTTFQRLLEGTLIETGQRIVSGKREHEKIEVMLLVITSLRFRNEG